MVWQLEGTRLHSRPAWVMSSSAMSNVFITRALICQSAPHLAIAAGLYPGIDDAHLLPATSSSHSGWSISYYSKTLPKSCVTGARQGSGDMSGPPVPQQLPLRVSVPEQLEITHDANGYVSISPCPEPYASPGHTRSPAPLTRRRGLPGNPTQSPNRKLCRKGAAPPNTQGEGEILKKGRGLFT